MKLKTWELASILELKSQITESIDSQISFPQNLVTTVCKGPISSQIHNYHTSEK